jgi:hypothetical protein
MSRLYLPIEHSEIDRALAIAVAEAVDSAELFVAWTLDGGAARAPEPVAPKRRPTHVFGRAFAGLRSFWARLTGPSRGPAGHPVPATRGSRLEGVDLQP